MLIDVLTNAHECKWMQMIGEYKWWMMCWYIHIMNDSAHECTWLVNTNDEWCVCKYKKWMMCSWNHMNASAWLMHMMNEKW